jgi:hypothetical protein
LCEKKARGCLCTDCKCRDCYWYKNTFNDFGEKEGYCELAMEERIWKNEYGDKQIKNITQSTSRAVFGELEGKIGWIPLSVINKDGFVKNWFTKRFKNKRNES